MQDFLFKVTDGINADSAGKIVNLAPEPVKRNEIGTQFLPLEAQKNPSSATPIDWAIAAKNQEQETGKKVVGIRTLVNEFHKVWYPLQGTCTWMGYEMQKCPLDLLIYSEIIYENRPDLLIECGTWKGGSALFFAHLFDIVHRGTILTIDINRWPGFPIHPRIMYLTASSVAEDVIKQVGEIASTFKNVMVILDSDHGKEHVLKELENYSELVTRGQYLVVEDTNIHGHPVREDLPPGPFEAVEEWLPAHEEFYRDQACERYLLTMHPNGWLRRVK